MTKAEAIGYLLGEYVVVHDDNEYEKELNEAIDMAIGALREPKTIIGIDIPYGSDKGIATLFKGKDDKLILEEVKETMSVVRCKDCKHWASAEDYDCEIHSGAFGADDFCSYGERKGGENE